MSKSSVAGLYEKSILRFLRSLHTFFHSGYTSLHSHQQCVRVLFSQHSCQHLLLFVFLMVAIITGVRWTFNVVLILISLWPGMVRIFHVFCSHLDFFLWKGSVQFICPFLRRVIDTSGSLVFSALCICYHSLAWCIAGIDSLPFCR
jgi:hypothetical protein